MLNQPMSKLAARTSHGLPAIAVLLGLAALTAFASSAAAQSGPGTTLKITNSTKSTVPVMITLGAGFGIASIAQLPKSWGVVASPSGQTLQGIFPLRGGASVTFNSGSQSFSGNVSFGPTFTARGCGNPVAKACYPNATNLAEFTLNQTGETVDLSNVNGVNAQINISFTGQTARNSWNNGAGGSSNVTSIVFQPISKAGSGVYGWQATTCTASPNPPNPLPNCPAPVAAPSQAVLQSVAQCNIQRLGTAPTGGTVEVLFGGFVEGSVPAANCVSP